MDKKAAINIMRMRIWYGVLAMIIPTVYYIDQVYWLDAFAIFGTSFAILLAVHIFDDINGYMNGTDRMTVKEKQDIGEPKMLVSGRLNLSEATVLAFSMFIIAMLGAIWLVTSLYSQAAEYALIILILGGVAAGMGYSYSGKPLQLSYHGLGESVLVVCAGIIPVMVSQYIYVHTFTTAMFFVGLGCGLMFASVLSRSNLLDVQGDIASDRWTLTAIYYRNHGAETVKMLHVIFMGAGFIYLIYGLYLLFGLGSVWPFLIVLVVPFMLYHWMHLDGDIVLSRKRVFTIYQFTILMVIIAIVLEKWVHI